MQATTVSNVDRYEKMDKLGEGTYGVVYKAKDRQTGEVSHDTLGKTDFIYIDCRTQENKARKGGRWSPQYCYP